MGWFVGSMHVVACYCLHRHCRTVASAVEQSREQCVRTTRIDFRLYFIPPCWVSVFTSRGSLSARDFQLDVLVQICACIWFLFQHFRGLCSSISPLNSCWSERWRSVFQVVFSFNRICLFFFGLSLVSGTPWRAVQVELTSKTSMWPVKVKTTTRRQRHCQDLRTQMAAAANSGQCCHQ